MPWRTATAANERARFVIEAELSDLSHSELCRRYGISRPTGYRWIERYQAEGLFGLEQVEDAVWSVYFGPAHLGWLDQRDFRIMDVKEQSRRRR